MVPIQNSDARVEQLLLKCGFVACTYIKLIIILIKSSLTKMIEMMKVFGNLFTVPAIFINPRCACAQRGL